MGDVLRWPKQVIHRIVPTSIAGRFPCLFGHRWSAWSEPWTQNVNYVDVGHTITRRMQYRTCQSCNLTQYKRVKGSKGWE